MNRLDIMKVGLLQIANELQQLIALCDAQKRSESESESTIKVLLDDYISFSGGKKGGEDMPPRYADGSLREIGKSGLLQYRFMSDGKQVSVYGYTEKECFRKRYEYDRTPRTGKEPEYIPAPPMPTRSATTYKKWTELWLKEKKQKCKPGYYKAILMYLNNDILPKIGTMNISELNPEQLQAFLSGIDNDNKRTKVAAILSESLRRAYELQKVERNPFIGVVFKAYESPHKPALTHKEQLTLLESIPDKKLLALTKLLLLTGLRQGEALALTADDIKKDSIRITKSLNKHTGAVTKPKTKASVRTVPINDYLRKVLQPYAKKERLFDFENDYLSKTYSKLFRSLNIKATGHTLRHTFITNAFEIGVPPHIVQRWAGHAKAEQADTYLDLRKSKDFIKTDIVDYMLELKNKYVPKV